MQQTGESERLFTFEFVSLCFVCFFAFCNMSVFYSFFSYLGRIGIPEEWRGFLVGLEPMSAFALRLVVIPLVHLGNAAGVMLLALLMTVVALCSYLWAESIPALIALRIFHGAAFVLLVSAAMALVVYLIPKAKSAQGFGLVSVTVLVPYAVMPLVTEALLPHLKNEATIYAGVTVLALPGILLLLVLQRRLRGLLQGAQATLMRRPSLREIQENFHYPGVVILLVVNLLLYLSYSTVFFFIKAYMKSAGAGDPGVFFTIATLVMIAVRVFSGTLLDRVDKVKTLIASALLLVVVFALLGHIRSLGALHALAALYGLGFGVMMPVLNAAMFHASPESLRGLNTNLALFMMDGGFFVSAYTGGWLLASGHSFGTLFNLCAGLLMAIVGLLAMLGRVAAERRQG